MKQVNIGYILSDTGILTCISVLVYETCQTEETGNQE